MLSQSRSENDYRYTWGWYSQAKQMGAASSLGLFFFHIPIDKVFRYMIVDSHGEDMRCGDEAFGLQVWSELLQETRQRALGEELIALALHLHIGSWVVSVWHKGRGVKAMK